MLQQVRKIHLLLFLLSLLFSCSDNSFEEIVEDEVDLTRSLTYEELEDAAHIFASFVNEPAVRDEIISYATKNTDFEVYRPFCAILSEEELGRKRSVLAKRLTQELTSSECERCRSDLVPELERLLEAGYAIYAPYLAEDLADSDQPLTISWWDGQDTTGVTQGIVFGESGRVNATISVDDNYAATNPTIVLVPNDDAFAEEYCAIGAPCDTRSFSNSDIPSTPRDIDCRELAEDAILRLEMPQYRLLKNTRWPQRNRLYLWIVVGDYSFNDEGLIAPSPKIGRLWGEHGEVVSRKDARKANWRNSNTSFILSNWKQSQDEMRIVLSYKKSFSQFKLTSTVNIDTDGDFTRDTEVGFSLEKKTARNMFDVPLDRCETLANITSDEGFGQRDGYQIYLFNQFSFYLRPKINE